MKKGIIALVLAAVMVIGLSAAAFADDPDTKTTKVTYTRAQAYTWEVPSTITAGAAVPADNNVKASGVYIPYGTILTIKITEGIDSDNKVTLTDTATGANSNKVTALVTFAGVSVNAGTVEGGGAVLSVAEPKDVKMSGTYEGTLTFSAAVESATQTDGK